MKSDFLLAITQLSAEKNLPKDVVLTTVEAALVSAYKKDTFDPEQNIDVKINPSSGKVEVWAEKNVVQKVTDPTLEISLREAKKIQEDIKVGDALMVESTPANAGRIAAQTAKQVIGDANTKAQELLTKAQALVGEKKFEEAGNLLQKLADYELTPEQQKMLDNLKAAIQKAMESGAVKEGTKAIGNMLGGEE